MAIKDLTTFTLAGAQSAKLSATSATMTATSVDKPDDAYGYQDSGIGWLPGDFSHNFDVNISSLQAAGAPMFFGVVADHIGTYISGTGAGANQIGAYAQALNTTTYYLRVQKVESGAGAAEPGGTAYTATVGTTYYCTMRRVGLNAYVDIYSNTGRTTLLHSSTIALTAAATFRYAYGVQSWKGGVTGLAVSATISNLDITASTSLSIAPTALSGHIFQRTGGAATVSISGSTGGVAAVEARIKDSIGTQIVPWTAMTVAGASWSGQLSVPEHDTSVNSNYYIAEARDTAIPANVATDTVTWTVGARVLIVGQSNALRMSTIGATPTPAAMTAQFDGSVWVANTGAEQITLANHLQSVLNVPVAAINTGVASTGMLAKSFLVGGNDYWMNFSAGSIYDNMLTTMQAITSEAELVVIWQGERDAWTQVASTEDYQKAGIEYLIRSRLRADITNASSLPNLPVIVCPLGKGGASYGADWGWQQVRDAHYNMAAIDDVYVVPDAVTLATDPGSGGIHYLEPEMTTHAGWVDQAASRIYGLASYHEAPHIYAVRLINSTTLRVYIRHTGGTDFTPTTGIIGFRVFNGATELTVASATRATANTVDVVVSGGTVSNSSTVSYLYGREPVITAPVKDNSALTLPLRSTGEISPSENFVPEFNPSFDMVT